jgi:TonB-linked SusC/RagA family outer membrane protein
MKLLRHTLLTGCFLMLGASLWAQTKIQGTVKDSKTRQPIPGVTVVVEGTTTGAASDVNGFFRLTLPNDAKNLVFSIIGYTKKVVPVNGQTDFKVELEEETRKLNEVVVTALGVTREQRSLGYSTQKVGGAEVVGSGEQNFVQGLAAKVSGVQVIGSGGTPGASSKILLRGPHSFQGDGQPLIVIDGVPVDNSTASGNPASDNPYNSNLDGVNQSNRGIDINPQDIESIQVLKGPAAAALYGVRGGNGALIITTKRGSKGGIRATYSTSIEFSQVNKLPAFQNRYGQGLGGGSIDSLGNPVAAGDFVDGVPQSWGQDLRDPANNAKIYDNVKNFFRTGISFNNNLSVSGGNEKASFRIALGQARQNGVIPNTSFNRYTVRISGDAEISKDIKMSATLNYVRSGGTRAQNGSNLSGVMLGLLRSPVSFDLRGSGPDGYMNPDGTQRQYYPYYDNPYWTVYKNPYTDQVDRINGNMMLQYSPLKWFSASYRLGTDNYTDQGRQIFAIGSWAPANSPNGQIEESVSRYRNVYGDLLLNFEHNIKNKWFGSVKLGNNFWYTQTSSNYMRGRDLVLPEFYNLGNATNFFAANSSSETRSTALFFDVNLEYNKIVYLNITGRNEWYSTFLPGKSSFFFPAVNGAFVFSELMKKESKFFTFGKLRASYAIAGIPPLAAYQTRTYLSQPTLADGWTSGNSFPFLGTNGYGYSSLGFLGNSKLRPETNRNIEVGLDLRFFDNRLRVDVNYFNQKSRDLLLSVKIPSTSGMKYTFVNAASMVNQGIEFNIGTDVIKRKNFTWSIDVNGTWFKNKVTQIYKDLEQIEVESGFDVPRAYAAIGQPYGALFGYAWERNASGNLVIGSDGLPKVDPQLKMIGNPWPSFWGGLRNTFQIRDFTIGFLWDFRVGGDVWAGTVARLYRLGRMEETVNRNQTYVIPGVKEDGSANNIPVSAYDYFRVYKGDAAGVSATENSIYSSSWARLREINLGYKFRFKQCFLKTMDVNFTVRNALLFTKYPGVDPETSLTGAGSNINGFDYFNNPGTRSYILGLNFNF